MKKFILIPPLALVLSIFSINANLEAAGCSSHKNNNVKVECSLEDDKCNKLQSEEKFNKVEV